MKLKKTVLALSVAAVSAWGSASGAEGVQPRPSSDSEEGFVPLFDGKTLGGWIVRGGENRYSVVDGCIRGVTVPSTCGINTFLTTEREYADFDLRVEFRIEGGNSGIQFRSKSRPVPDAKGGPDRQKVFGYQAEITADGGSTGRIYDEERRGYSHGLVWLDVATPKDRLAAAKESFRKNGWNEMRVVCEGPRIRTYLNGNLVADILDDLDAKGFIGLQMHLQHPPKDGGKFWPGVVWWRNVRIRELASSSGSVKRFPLDRETTRRVQDANGANDLTVIETGGRKVIRLNGFEVWDSARK